MNFIAFASKHRRNIAIAAAAVLLLAVLDSASGGLNGTAPLVILAYIGAAAYLGSRHGRKRAALSTEPIMPATPVAAPPAPEAPALADDSAAIIADLEAQLAEEREMVAALTGQLSPESVNTDLA